MTNQHKETVRARLAEYCSKYGSQNKAANSLKGVSAGTISQILNKNWEQITDDMFKKVGKQIGATSNEMVIVKTENYKFITKVLQDSKENGYVYSIVSPPGTSKSEAAKAIVRSDKNAYRVECNEYWNKKMFLYEISTSIGLDANGLNVNEMVQLIVRTLKVQDQPLLILDEFDKVSDQLLYFFITFYNQLSPDCGIVTLSTDYLEKRVKRGLRLGKKGYAEFYSRIGRRFVAAPGNRSVDIQEVCRANGIIAPGDIKTVVEDCDNDLRRVERKIHALKRAA